MFTSVTVRFSAGEPGVLSPHRTLGDSLLAALLGFVAVGVVRRCVTRVCRKLSYQ